MKVILLGELRGKGGEGDIIDVAQGYAENYLFPNGIAQPATPGNIKQLEQRRNNIAQREAKRITDAEALREQIDGKVVVVDVKVGDQVFYGKFGGNEIKVDGEEYLRLRGDDIYAIIEG